MEKMRKTDLHVVFSSDIHYSDQIRSYGVKMDDRMQHWVDSILAEHKKEPIDLLVVNGDISQDHWNHPQWAPETGNCVRCGMESTIPNLIDRYINVLRQYFPVFVMSGNHEQYTDAEWKELVGNKCQDSMIIGNTLFLFLNNFKVDTPPTVCSCGSYTATDVAYIYEMLEKHPNYDVYLVAHYFDTAAKDGEVLIESALQELLVGNERIKGLFAGHTHGSRVQNLGSEWGNKTIAQTGNFSFNFPSSTTDLPFWGFRELIVTSDTVYSQYISVDGIANDANTASYTRTISDSVWYE